VKGGEKWKMLEILKISHYNLIKRKEVKDV